MATVGYVQTLGFGAGAAHWVITLGFGAEPPGPDPTTGISPTWGNSLYKPMNYQPLRYQPMRFKPPRYKPPF